MKFLSQSQCVSWAKEIGWPLAEDLLPMEPAELTKVAFRIPEDAGRRVALAKILLEPIISNGPCLMWITTWGIWPSGEHSPLFYQMRSAFGEHRSLQDIPGQLFDVQDRDAALSHWILATLFLWDCHVLSVDGQRHAFVSHDEWGYFSSTAKDELAAIGQLVTT